MTDKSAPLTQDQIDALQGGYEQVEALGKTWTLAHVGPGIRDAFSSWCKLRAKQRVVEDGDITDRKLFNEEVGAGAYKWGTPYDPKGMGSGVASFFNQGEGKVKLLQLLLEPVHGELAPEGIIELLNAKPDEFDAATRECMGLPPNPKAPAAGAKTKTPNQMAGPETPLGISA